MDRPLAGLGGYGQPYVRNRGRVRLLPEARMPAPARTRPLHIRFAARTVARPSGVGALLLIVHATAVPAARPLPGTLFSPEVTMTAPSARPADATASAGDRPALVPSEAATFPDTADERAVRDVVLAVGRAADAHDWPGRGGGVRAAGRARLRHGPKTSRPPAIVARWEPLLEAFDRTTHEVTDVQVAVTGTARRPRVASTPPTSWPVPWGGRGRRRHVGP
jgi:hypothetical protein